jgi:hypothetical protein
VKSLKMLGLAALAALMAMALVGASSAMAESTGLCSVDQEPCEEKNEITHVHETTLAGEKATLLSSAGNVTCTVLFLGDTIPTTATPLIIEGKFTYTECERSGSSCEVKEENGPVEIEVLKEGHETAKVTGKGEVNVHCGFFINCTYNGEGLKGTAKGPLLSTETNGEVSLSEQTTKKVKGSLCPETAKLDITTTPLAATYIGASPLLHACVEVGTERGFFLDSQCTVKDATRLGRYELTWVLPTAKVEKHACLYVGPNRGFYLGRATWEECKEKDEKQLGKWELVIIVAVF